jgi:prepilin signal peptidase PulO-like enzyme (type II secretory pathway)
VNALTSSSICATLVALYGLVATRRAAGYGLTLRVCDATFVLPGALTVAVAAVPFEGSASCWMRAAVLACVAVCCATDLQTGYVFDAVLLAALAVLLPASGASGHLRQGMCGAFAGGALPLVAFLWSRGRWIGLGDVKLAGIVGMALGSRGALLCLWVACVLGGCVALWMLVTKRAGRRGELRFAPFIAVGTCAALLAGRAL